MADRQQNYPDSTGARWDAGAAGRRGDAGDRPAFLERTEAIGRQDRPGGTSIDDLMGARDRLPTRGPSEDVNRRRVDPPAAQWSLDREPVSSPPGADPNFGDPELAAAAGIESAHGTETGSFNRQPPRPPVQAPPVQTPVQAPPVQQMHPQGPPPTHDPAMMGGINEPTQLHNPVQHTQMPQQQMSGDYGQQRRQYPEQVADGVYRRSRPGLGIALAVVTAVMAALVALMLITTLTEGKPFNPSAVVSGVFALAGLPLTAWGLYPLLGMGANSGPDHYSALLRAPYIYLLTGVALLLAAGLAA